VLRAGRECQDGPFVHERLEEGLLGRRQPDV